VIYLGFHAGLAAYDAAGTTNCSGTPKTCQPLWTAATFYPQGPSPPTVANGVVYVSSGECSQQCEITDSALEAFDAAGTTNCSGVPKTCQPLWATFGSSETSDLRSSAVISHGVVYVGLDKLYAFGLEKVPPTTAILIPSNGATVSSTTTLGAKASDNRNVSRVEFHLTGGSYHDSRIGVATRTYYGWLFDWDTTSVPNGAYTLNSVAFDPAGNRARSPDISITVQN
jgi:hypothetical protein